MENSKKRAAIMTLGCKVNSYESDAMEESLINAGYFMVDFNEVADVYIINTCTVTSIADKKSRQMISRARKNNEDAIIVACGCFVQNKNGDELKNCDIIIGNNKKTKIVQEIEEFSLHRKKRECKEDISKKDTSYENLFITRSVEKTRAGVKIQDGCNHYCSYCAIPFARGISRSRDVKDIIKEANTLSQNGHKEIVLTGVNLSDYHTDEDDLISLVCKLNEIESILRIRIGSLEPDVFSRDFVRQLSSLKKICPHFHFSLQSACDNTLRNMNRGYSVDTVIKASETLREYYDNPSLSADIILGFPGESQEDFLETYKNVEKIGFINMHIFPYSDRAGTKASKMENKIIKSEKNRRCNLINDLSDKLTKEYMDNMIGRELEVLFEEELQIGNESYFTGYSGEYIRCIVNKKEDLKGQIRKVKGEELMDNHILKVSLQL